MWTAADITIEIEAAEDPVMLVTVRTPAGVIAIIGNVSLRDGTLTIDKAHVQGLSPGALTRAGLNAVGARILEESGARRLVVQGSARTTGANLGSIPRPIRFPRRLLPDGP